MEAMVYSANQIDHSFFCFQIYLIVASLEHMPSAIITIES